MTGAFNPALTALVAIGAMAWVMALAAAADRGNRAMLAWCGLALAANPQAMCWAPLIVALLVGRRVPARHWPVAPLSFLGAITVVRLAGWPTPDPGAIYIGQAGWSPALATNAPNVWAIVQALPWINDLPLAGLALAAWTGVTAWFAAQVAWRPPTGSRVVAAGLSIALITAGILPGMTWHAFGMAQALALMLAVMRGDRRSWAICALVETGSALATLGYLTGIDAGAILGAVPMIVATVLIARQFLVSPANDNGLPLNPFRAYPV